MSGSNIPNAAEGGRLAARPMTHNVVFDEAFPGDGLPAHMRVASPCGLGCVAATALAFCV